MHLEIDQLTAWHPAGTARTTVLQQISLTIPSGAMAAVLGPSGSGKSTLLRVVAGLHRHATGTIRLGSRPVHSLPPERRGVGLVPQDGALFPHLTVAENVAFGLPRPRRRTARVDDMLDILDITAFADRFPHQLSGGQAQRVAVARALAPAPDLLLLDEPFSALDAGLRGAVRDRVRTALIETGTTALLVTHDQGEALSMATQLIVLADGRVRQSGAPEALYTAPADLWTGLFLGDANTFDATSDGRCSPTPLGALHHPPVPPGEVTVLVRPEQIELSAERGEFNATIGPIRYFGHDALLTLTLDAGCAVLARVSAPVEHRTGDRVAASVAGGVRAYSRPAAAEPSGHAGGGSLDWTA